MYDIIWQDACSPLELKPLTLSWKHHKLTQFYSLCPLAIQTNPVTFSVRSNKSEERYVHCNGCLADVLNNSCQQTASDQSVWDHVENIPEVLCTRHTHPTASCVHLLPWILSLRTPEQLAIKAVWGLLADQEHCPWTAMGRAAAR